MAQIASGDQTSLNVIIKADSYGSLEALKYALASMAVPENMNVKVIQSDVGTFGESDLALAQAAAAIIIGFNIPIPASILKKAQQLKVNIKTYDIIYQMTDYIDGILKGMIVIEAKEVFLGRLIILGIFFKKEKEMIIGGKVEEGEVKKPSQIIIIRDGVELGRAEILELQQSKVSARIIEAGEEFGMKVKTTVKVLAGDVIESFEEKIKQKTL